jgi:hypothetical protein
MSKTALDAYDRLLSQVVECFDANSTRRLVELRADPATQARVEELADKCTEGLLTQEELEEYNAYIRAANLIAILQAKARKVLSSGEGVTGARSSH